MQHLERFLVELDSGPSSGVSRVALGLCIPPVFRALSGGRDQIWIDLVLFLALLIGLRVIPAVLRKSCRFRPKQNRFGPIVARSPSCMTATSGRSCSGSVWGCCPMPSLAAACELANGC